MKISNFELVKTKLAYLQLAFSNLKLVKIIIAEVQKTDNG